MALPVADASVDAAVMALVLFFVPDPARGVAEMVRVVRPGGIVAAYHWDILGGGFPWADIGVEQRNFGERTIQCGARHQAGMTVTKSKFEAKLLRPAKPGSDESWSFLILPKAASEKFPRRGRTTAEVSVNGYGFEATLEPDGQLSHWLRISAEQLEAAGAGIGDVVKVEIAPVQQEPEPEIPPDLAVALAANPDARAGWDSTTTIARLDWIHWMTSARQAKTREKRINDACDMLATGKGHVCCFDQSGYYSKAFSAPLAAD